MNQMTAQNNNQIAVSVVVAAYNREDLLDRCIDSLVFQTLQEIEIILVDDFSTDNSLAVMERWQKRFPEKIRILRSAQKGVAPCKNTGIQAARGKYIAFLDTDDYVDYKMLKRMYAKAQENDYPEIVYAPLIKVTGAKRQVLATVPDHTLFDEETGAEQVNTEAYLSQRFFFLHDKLFRADLFERFGLLPSLSIGEDVSWVFPVISHVKTIAYCNVASYYYELCANSITLAAVSQRTVEDILRGSLLLIEKANPLYRKQAIVYAFRRVSALSQGRLKFRWLFDRFALENRALLEEIEDWQTTYPELSQFCEEARCCYDRQAVPIYLNGFGKGTAFSPEDQYENILSREHTFVVLDSRSCDLSGCPETVSRAYEAGDLNFVCKYFAIQKCYENGGFFIDEDVVVDAPFDAMLRDPSFFGFESNDTFSEKVFGGQPGNLCMKRILHTYNDPSLYDDEFASLSQRIKTIVIGMTNTAMGSKLARYTNQGVCLYPVSQFVAVLPFAPCSRTSHYQPEAFSDEQQLRIPAATIEALSDMRTKAAVDALGVPSLVQQRNWLKKQRTSHVEQIEKLRKDIDWVQARRSVLIAKNEELASLNGKLRADVDWVQAKRGELTTKNEELSSLNGKLRADMDWVQTKRRELTAKNEELSSLNGKLRTDIDWVQAKRRELTAKNEELSSLNGKLRTDIDWVQAKRRELSAKNAELTKKHEGLTKEHEGLLLLDEKHRADIRWLQTKRNDLAKKNSLLKYSLSQFQESRLARLGRKFHLLRRKVFRRRT